MFILTTIPKKGPILINHEKEHFSCINLWYHAFVRDHILDCFTFPYVAVLRRVLPDKRTVLCEVLRFVYLPYYHGQTGLRLTPNGGGGGVLLFINTVMTGHPYTFYWPGTPLHCYNSFINIKHVPRLLFSSANAARVPTSWPIFQPGQSFMLFQHEAFTQVFSSFSRVNYSRVISS